MRQFETCHPSSILLRLLSFLRVYSLFFLISPIFASTQYTSDLTTFWSNWKHRQGIEKGRMRNLKFDYFNFFRLFYLFYRFIFIVSFKRVNFTFQPSIVSLDSFDSGTKTFFSPDACCSLVELHRFFIIVQWIMKTLEFAVEWRER